MFRLLRMSEFDTTKALDALRRTITFRIQNRYELTWSPLPYKSRHSFPASRPLSARHSVSRGSTRMGRASPAPSLSTSISTEATSVLGGDEDEDGPSLDDDLSPSLIQLYPASSKDARCWPILTFSASALHLVAPSTGGWTSYFWSNSNADPDHTEPRLLSPKEQVLASYERVRRYMSLLGDEEGVPLQFVLIIDLAGANINTTVSVLQIPVCFANWSHILLGLRSSQLLRRGTRFPVPWDVRRRLCGQLHVGVQCFVGLREVCSLLILLGMLAYLSQATTPKYHTITYILPFHRRPRWLFWSRSPSSRYSNRFLCIIFFILVSNTTHPALGGVRLKQVPFNRPVFKTHLHTNTGHGHEQEQEPTLTNGVALVNQNGSARTTMGEQNSTADEKEKEKAATVPISRTSSQNPYFGYPSLWSWSASSGPGRPAHSLQHDRRRKRDLARTLLWLFLLRSQARLASLLRFLSRVLLGSQSARWTRRLARPLALVVALVVGWIAKHELVVNSVVSIDWNALTAS